MVKDNKIRLIERAKMVIQRLEKLAADSAWQHRSSGLRGSLLKMVERFETDSSALGEENSVLLESLIHQGLEILAGAAQEIPDPDS